jgi:hypothetical protein
MASYHNNESFFIEPQLNSKSTGKQHQRATQTTTITFLRSSQLLGTLQLASAGRTRHKAPPEKPGSGTGNCLQGAGLLEQVGGAGHHLQLAALELNERAPAARGGLGCWAVLATRALSECSARVVHYCPKVNVPKAGSMQGHTT